MACPERGDEEKLEMSADDRRWCPLGKLRPVGGRKEVDASGVLFRLAGMLLVDMTANEFSMKRVVLGSWHWVE